MSEDLRTALRAVAAAAPPAVAPDDLWRRGRRQRRRVRAAAAALAAVAVLAGAAAVPALLGPGPDGSPAGGGPAVPARLHLPWMWQATVGMDPPGPATVVFSGTGAGLNGSDLYDHEGKVATVGPGGYRMLLFGLAEQAAGVDVLVSPDGRYVAGGPGGAGPAIVDLTTGRPRTYPQAGTGPGAVAWSPDGATLLVARAARTGVAAHPVLGTIVPGDYVLFDVATGAVRPLVTVDHLPRLRVGGIGAFSADGRRVAVTVGDELRVFDTAGGAELWRTPLGPDRHLAGTGAFTPDGRVATVTLDGCRDDCSPGRLDARRWTLGFLDAATGREATGPAFDPVTAMGVRLLGWAHGAEPVVVRHTAAPGVRADGDPYRSDLGFWETGHVSVAALSPGGGTRTLLDPPDEVTGVDVPLDLVRAGAFGGPGSAPSVLPARRVVLLPALGFGAPLAVLAALLAVWAVRRRR